MPDSWCCRSMVNLMAPSLALQQPVEQRRNFKALPQPGVSTWRMVFPACWCGADEPDHLLFNDLIVPNANLQAGRKLRQRCEHMSRRGSVEMK